MQFDFGFYSSMLLIFFVHGIVYAILLYKKAIKNESIADKWLSLFLLLCVLYISPWMLGFAGWYDKQPYRDFLFYFPFQQLFFIGPVIFFYVQSLLNPHFKFSKKHSLHLLPGVLYLLYSMVIFLTDKLILKKYYFLSSGQDPDFENWYQYAGFISMVIYFGLSMRYYAVYKKIIVQVVSYADTVLFKWIRNFLAAFLIILLLKVLFEIFSLMPAFSKLNYVGPWWQFFSFSIVFYYIAITGYSNTIIAKVPFKFNLLESNPVLLLKNENLLIPYNSFVEEVDFEEISIDNSTKEKKADEVNLIAEWKPKIIDYIKNEKAYEDAELSLTQVAKKLQTNASIISKVINNGFNVNFNDFVNSFRIEAVKEKFLEGEHKNQTLLGIAYDCGFNSKATFNRAFKKVTDISPKEWLEKNI
jgi:AraC-like DNA-binding protein